MNKPETAQHMPPMWAACGCTMSAFAFTPCPTHRAAPRMLETLSMLVTLVERGERITMEDIDEARAILREMEG